MNITDYQGDVSIETHGRWVTFDDAEFLIAADRNPKHRKTINRLGKTKYQAALRKNDDAEMQKMTNEATAEALLLDWKGVKTRNAEGEEIDFPYSKPNAILLLSTSKIFREFVETSAMDAQAFVRTTEAAAVGELKSGDSVASPVGRPGE